MESLSYWTWARKGYTQQQLLVALDIYLDSIFKEMHLFSWFQFLGVELQSICLSPVTVHESL